MNPKIETWFEDRESALVERLREFLRVPSISTDPGHKEDMVRACDMVAGFLKDAGVGAEVLETAGHPAVLADTGPAEGPTILVYGHYDVQPPGDLSLWDSPPFEPNEREGAIFARGSADDKGQVLCHLNALQAWMETEGALPCRVKILIEGEEEIGSPSLEALVQRNRERLACDVVAISDTSKLSREIPAITYGTKGLVYKDIKVHGPRRDLHSGTFGGTVANPGNVVASLVAALKDEGNRVKVPGFYDDVVDPSKEERTALAAIPFDEAQYLADRGSPALDGEEGWSTLERRWARPTLDVNGLYGGFGGEGAMTIVPSMCGAKVSMRIVPDQDPDRVSDRFDAYLRDICPDTVRLEIDTFGMVRPYMTPLDLPALDAARRALRDTFGHEPAMIREGGTIPIMALFKAELGAESVLLGFADPNCNLHSPNEFFHLSDYRLGGLAVARFYAEMARL